MEKRVLLAALISSLFLAWYVQSVVKPTPPARPDASAITKPAPSAISSDKQLTASEKADIYYLDKEDVVTIESEHLAVEIGTASGAIRQATLKKFLNTAKTSQLRAHTGMPLFRAEPTQGLSWTLASHDADSAVLSSKDSDGNNYHITYEMDHHNSFINIIVTAIYQSNAAKESSDLSLSYSWTRMDAIDDRSSAVEAVLLEASDKKPRHQRLAPLTKGERTVPLGTTIVSLAERYFCQSARWEGEPVSVTVFASPPGTILAKAVSSLAAQGTTTSYAGTIYLGPRDYFELKSAGLETAFPIGVIGKIGLLLLLGLSWIASLTHNYGVAIVLFSALVTCMTAPFTMMSFKSMKKMQALKPHMDKLMAKHKDDPKKANKEVFRLYKAHKVSPISGCLPMLLQMPIFIALFQALTHFIRLRGQSFLWIDDLSMPDRLTQFSFSLPLLGNEFNLLPILMAAAMYAQTKMSQQASAQIDANPTAKMMSGPFMSIIFGVMFYHIPSGLVLYWLTNSLMSMVWYRVAR